MSPSEGAQSASPQNAPESRQNISPNWEDPWATRRDALRASLARARAMKRDIDSGRVENAAAISAREGLTRARISQLLGLLRLAPTIIARLEDTTTSGAVPRELELRKIAGLASDEVQVAAYEKLCVQESSKRQRRKTKPRQVVGRKGYRHLLEQARRYHEALSTKRVQSIAALGRAEGVSGSRIGQIMVLLYLAPDIIEQLESTDESLPGVTVKELRRIARIRDQARQRKEFGELLG